MNEKWWERPTCFLCNYWWLLLLVVVLGLTAYFSRGFWFPKIMGETVIPPPRLTPFARQLADNESVTNFPDPEGLFAFSPPLDWSYQDLGSQTHQWALPDGAVVSVHSEPLAAGDTLDNYAQEVTTRLPYDVLKQEQSQVGGQLAIRQEIAYAGQDERIAVGYIVFYNDRKYLIALAGLDMIDPSEQERIILEFENVLSTFLFNS